MEYQGTDQQPNIKEAHFNWCIQWSPDPFFQLNKEHGKFGFDNVTLAHLKHAAKKKNWMQHSEFNAP